MGDASQHVQDLGSRYLARLGVPHPSGAGLDDLAALLRAHFASIPFENFDSFADRPFTLARVWDKLLSTDTPRGGYCMEHATLSAPALRALGFDAEQRLARVYFGRSGGEAFPLTHCVTLVHVGGRTVLYDPGFGKEGPLVPLDLGGGEASLGGSAWRIIKAEESGLSVVMRGSDAEWVVEYSRPREEKEEREWISLYGISREPTVKADIEAFNWFVCSYPASKFVNSVLGCAGPPGSQVTVYDRRFRRYEGGRVVEESTVGGLDELKLWVERMGIKLDDDHLKAVWAKFSALPINGSGA